MSRFLAPTIALGVALALAGPVDVRAQATAYTGATVWDGTGAPSRLDVTMLVEGGRIAEIGPDVSVPATARTVSLDGKFVIPGLVNAHGHVTGGWATDPSASEEERIRQDLRLYARYGVTSVNSLGDGRAALAVASEAHDGRTHARLLAAGPVVTAHDRLAAREAARRNVEAGAAWLKLRVDDNLGSSEPMPWDAVAAVLEVGVEHGVPVATHLFYLDDARRLLELGTDLVAHSVRDREVDADFVAQLTESGVCYVPTLTREVSTFVYGSRPDFFDDPFFRRFALAREVRRLEQPEVQRRFRESASAEGYRRALPRAEANLVTLHEAGARIAFGTDSGPPARFPGYFEHMELWMMVEAGLTPAEALRSATAVAADCSGFTEVGTLEVGRRADFLVLGEDPTVDIEATRSLERVFVGGREVSMAPGG
ncbi:MAG: amidohydrolase family protein [Gemmatimonadota bacterium]|nr:amidohydrolase family protein [Gemmatimonadota bacterium]